MFGFPHEGREDVLMTVKLLARIRPGRFRWAIFFPYVHTAAYETSLKGGFIDCEKMSRLTNFTEESCLNFGEEHNLWIGKLQKVFPWYVNAYADLDVSGFYCELVEDVESLPSWAWEEAQHSVLALDEELSGLFSSRGKEHYTVRYNDFMAVRRDWVEREEGGP
jgi:hypothetical protein